jgi:tRNA(fMet)-specific endonuclease VapC
VSFTTEQNYHKKELNRRKIEKLAESALVLASDRNTAKEYGKIKFNLKSKGFPIPENDIWIAAIAKQHDLILVTRDKHFNHIDLLQLESW